MARTHNLDKWVHKCLTDRARFQVKEEPTIKLVRLLERFAARELHDRHFAVAAHLFADAARLLMDFDVPVNDVEQAFQKALARWSQLPSCIAETWQVYEQLYTWQWSGRLYDRALETLRAMIAFVTGHHDHFRTCQASDQLGVCLQELSRYDEANAAHQSALTSARRAQDGLSLEHVLNNLGELRRKVGAPKDAIPLFREAESLARVRKDVEAVISVAHNRALALFDAGLRTRAVRLFTTCRDTARRHGLWHEVVRGQHALANCAFQMQAPHPDRLYLSALAAAKKHGIEGETWKISLNYANILRSRGKSRKALRYYRDIEPSLHNLPDGHVYLAQLAQCYEDVSDFASAAETWNAVRLQAETVGKDDSVAIASAALATLYERVRKFAKADVELQTAIQHEHESWGHAYLLLQRLSLFLAWSKEEDAKKTDAKKTFANLQKIIRDAQSEGTEGLEEVLIDMHMMLADHNWQDDDGRQEAMKAYSVALMVAFRSKPEQVGEVGGHVYRRLLEIPRKNRLAQIRQLEDGLNSWLCKQTTGTIDEALRHFITWPLRVVRRLTMEHSNDRSISGKEAGRIAVLELA